MTFLAPLFLLGLAAVAVPLILHLIHRERVDAVQFPSLMFLKRVPHKSVRRRRVRDKLLLAFRILALALLAAAFARPFVDRAPAAGAGLMPARDVVILIDRSYSMGYGDHFERAVATARSTIDGLRPRDRAAIVFFDERASAVTEQTGDATVLRAALDTARVGTARTRYGPAVSAAQALLDATDRPAREIVLISDFQQGGWDADGAGRLAAGTSLTTVPIGAASTANTLVTGVSLAREAFAGRERVRLTAQLAHRSASARTARVTLEIEGQAVQTQSVELQPHGTAEVVFGPITLATTAQRASIGVETDLLPVDDVHHLMLAPVRPIRVLLVRGRAAAAPSSLYLERALAIGESPAFSVGTAASVTAANLEAADVVVLNGAPWPTGAAGERLQAFVEAGGGVLAVLGATGSVPAEIARTGVAIDRTSSGGGAIGYVDYAHPALELFREPRNGDLRAASFYRYRSVEPAEGTRVLARYDDGAAALLEAVSGRGRVFVLTSTLDTYWSSLPLQPVFLPLLHRILADAADWAPEPPALRVGEVMALANETERGTILAPDGAALSLAENAAVLRVEQPGFYEVRDPSNQRVLRRIAVNTDRRESDLTAMAPAALQAALAPAGAAEGPALAGAVLTLEERERRQSLWWYVLAAAIALLAGEAVLATRSARAAPEKARTP